MKNDKSSRHSKITGDFGEALVLYWLSKRGYECARVDHVGIDLIAKPPGDQRQMGISVKTRSRTDASDTSYVSVPIDNYAKAMAACTAFGCEPYFAIVVDGAKTVWGFILSMEKLQRLCPPGERVSAWQMTPNHVRGYLEDHEIKTFTLDGGKNW